MDSPFWDSIEKIVSNLRLSGCRGIQAKIRDVGLNTSKFSSIVAELEIAWFLARKGKRNLWLLADDFLPGKSPDLAMSDNIGDHYVEVVLFSDDETTLLIYTKMEELLHSLDLSYLVDITLPYDLSGPAIRHEERNLRDSKVEKVLNNLGRVLKSRVIPAGLPTRVVIDNVAFDLRLSSIGKGGVGIIQSTPVSISPGLFTDRIRFLVSDRIYGKANKREDWSGSDLSRFYVIAINCGQLLVQEEYAIEALLGQRASYTCFPTRNAIPKDLVEEVARRSWRTFLERVHIIPKGRTSFISQGVYLTEPVCKNVSGVLVYMRNRDSACFIPNPFAFEEICDSRLTGFLDNYS